MAATRASAGVHCSHGSHNIPALASPASIPRTAALVVKFDEVLREDDDDMIARSGQKQERTGLGGGLKYSLVCYSETGLACGSSASVALGVDAGDDCLEDALSNRLRRGSAEM